MPRPTFDRMKVFGQLAVAVAQDPGLLEQLRHSFTPEWRDRFTGALQALLPDDHQALVKDVWTGFMTYCK